MLRHIIIIGNSGAALECYSCMQEMLAISSFHSVYKFKGFLSHRGFEGDLAHLAHFDLGNDANYIPQENDVFVLGIGDNKVRLQAYEDMKAKNGEFTNIISPLVHIGENVQIGEGNNIMKYSNISNNVIIGNANYLNGSVVVGHDVNIGNANYIATFSSLYGHVKIGNNNSLAPNSILLENSKIGDNNKIAPAAVVYKGCQDNALMAGNPAVKIANTNKEILV